MPTLVFDLEGETGNIFFILYAVGMAMGEAGCDVAQACKMVDDVLACKTYPDALDLIATRASEYVTVRYLIPEQMVY